MSTRPLSMIDPSAFAHPLDQQASAALAKVPLLPDLLTQASRLRAERTFRALMMYNGIRLGPRQLPSLWRMVNDVAERFGMSLPSSYVTGDRGANAFAFGLHDHSIALTADLVDLMSDRELEAIIAHELAHILCQHMLYRQVGLALTDGASDWVGGLLKLSPAMLRASIAVAFFSWSRAAEYSADRAALFVLDDAEALASCFSRLAGVPRRFASEFDPRQFAKQVEEYKQEETVWSRVVTWDLGLLRTHPEPTRRAAAVLEWADSDDFRRIRNGDFPVRAPDRASHIEIPGMRNCPLCKNLVGDDPTCSVCGLDQDPQRQSTCHACGYLVSEDWTYCTTCGHTLAARS